MTEMKKNTGGAIAKAVEKKAAVVTPERQLKSLITKMEPAIKAALPKVITPERFTRMALSAISNTPKLATCDQMTFIAAMMQSAQLGLEPNTPLGEAYLIPYGNKVQFQVGYKGLLSLVYRSGKIKTVQAHEVCQNDEFTYMYGLHPDLQHKPAITGRGPVIGYYAVFETTDGGFGFEYMSKEDITNHAKAFSKSYSSGPWQSNFDEMAKKTVLKRVLKYAPISSDVMKEINTDESVKTFAEGVTAADIVSQETEVFTVNEETGEVIND